MIPEEYEERKERKIFRAFTIGSVFALTVAVSVNYAFDAADSDIGHEHRTEVTTTESESNIFPDSPSSRCSCEVATKWSEPAEGIVDNIKGETCEHNNLECSDTQLTECKIQIRGRLVREYALAPDEPTEVEESSDEAQSLIVSFPDQKMSKTIRCVALEY